MANNNFLAFGTQPGANVVDQATYAGMSELGSGYVSGIATSAKLNKTWRQSSFVSAAIGQFIADQGIDALDDGNLTGAGGLVPKLKSALTAYIQATGDARYALASALGSYLTTAAANAQYLKIVDAASTYATITALNAALANYLTTASAASTYLTQAGAAGTYLAQTVAAATYAPLASPNLSGSPTIINTPAPGSNNNLIANCAFVAAAILVGLAKSFAATGYIQLPGGIYINWGSSASTVGNFATNQVAVTFVQAFPTAFLKGIATLTFPSWGMNSGVTNGSGAKGGMTVFFGQGTGNGPFTLSCDWLAIGY